MNNFSSPVISQKNNFHLIRLVCCFIVMYEHFCVLTTNSLVCLNLRGEAVNVFFIISGFWITISLLRSFDISEYAKKRFVKIFPSYWLVVLFFSIFLFFFSTCSFYDYFCSKHYWKYLLSNFITLNFICPSLPGVFSNLGANGAVNGSLWTIQVEIGFYIILPIIITIFNRSKTRGRVILFTFLYFLSALFPILITVFKLPNSLSNQLPAYLGYFLCGVIFALYFDKLQNKLFYLFFPSVIIFVIGIIYKIYFFEPIVLSIIVFFMAFSIPNIIFIKKDYSYYMYLLHFPIIQIMNSLHLFDNTHYIFLFFLILSATFLGSVILEKTVSLLNVCGKERTK